MKCAETRLVSSGESEDTGEAVCHASHSFAATDPLQAASTSWPTVCTIFLCCWRGLPGIFTFFPLPCLGGLAIPSVDLPPRQSASSNSFCLRSIILHFLLLSPSLQPLNFGNLLPPSALVTITTSGPTLVCMATGQDKEHNEVCSEPVTILFPAVRS